MGNIMVIGALAVLVVLALMRSRKHFHGGCCGSGGSTLRSRKKLTEPKLGRRVLVIQGMHCENCQARVENAINRLDGAACTVSLRKRTATVSYSRPISDTLLKDTVEKLGYQVREIR